MPESNIFPLKPETQDRSARALLATEALSYGRGGRSLLNAVSFELNADPGITVLLGPNGAGKSLLLRLVGGLIKPDSGTIRFAPDFGGPIGMVFQKPVLLRRSVRANLLHALAIARIPRRERTGILARLLVEADLTHCAESPARALSGGEQQRLAMARALVGEPELMLLDEPTASLDPAATAAFESLVRKVAAGGARILLVTHDLHQARRIADDILFLHNGRLCEHTPAAAFFDNPASREADAYCKGTLLT